MDEATEPKQKAAKDNPWYRLATLHGEPLEPGGEIAARNRLTWNRWMAPRISDDLRADLLKKGWTEEELTPFSDDERRSIADQVGSSREGENVDFSDTNFEVLPFFLGFVFINASFGGAAFRDGASFAKAAFRHAYFAEAAFSGVTTFAQAAFSGQTSFARAAFNDLVGFEGTARHPADFESAVFRADVDFESAAFSGDANFAGTTFMRDAFFHSAVFVRTSFAKAAFTDRASFEKTTFSGDANFGSTAFHGRADFPRAAFNGYACFSSAAFSDVASFVGTAFRSRADFDRAVVFIDKAYFSEATFHDSASFASATFHNNAHFNHTNFGREVDFTNAEMKGRTNFAEVTFSEPPQCFNAKLHEGTTWHGVRWPETPRDVERARRFIDAYERLKLEMDKLKKHEDELKFFALEQQCRRVVDGVWKGLPIAIYGGLSDYGQSYVRPLVLIAAVLVVGAFLSAYHLVGFWAPMPGRAFGLSFANTFSVLGIRRDLIEPQVLQSFPAWLDVVATVQSILGIVLLFLFGLGIRNRFRIK